MKTRIYIADVTPLQDPELFERLFKVVPEARRQKAIELKNNNNKSLSLGAGLLLHIACNEAGIAGVDEHIAYTEAGKPFFAGTSGGSGVHFSLSHSGNRVMCAISDREVGCDVEQIRDVEADKLAGRFFHETEREHIAEQTDAKAKEEIFFRYWTLKESFIKCIGTGLRLPLNRFAVEIGTDIDIDVDIVGDRKGTAMIKQDTVKDDFYLTEVSAADSGASEGDGYRYACCVRAGKQDIEIVIIDLARYEFQI